MPDRYRRTSSGEGSGVSSRSATPGCLYASYSYEAQLFDEETHALIRKAILTWREAIGEKFRLALLHRPPRIDAAPEELADALLVVIEGAYVLSRTLKEPKLVIAQLLHYRNYLEMVFGELAEPVDAEPTVARRALTKA